MQKKLLFSYVIIIVTAIGISAAAFWSKGYSYLDQRSKEYYLLQAKFLAQLFETSNDSLDAASFVKQYAEEYKVRITLIHSDGTVLADSNQQGNMENHSTREEVVGALKGESVSLTRYSKTMGQEYSYSAVPVHGENFEGVMRVSLPISERKGLDQGLSRSLLSSLLTCVIVAIGLAFALIRYIAGPIIDVTNAAERISKGDYSIKIYTREKAELGRLASSFNQMAANLKTNMQNLSRRNIELEAILESMTSGVVAVDEANVILFYNHVFQEMLENDILDYSGRSLYTVIRNAIFFDVLDKARESGKSVTQEGYVNMSFSDTLRMLRVTAAPLSKGEEKNLGVLLVMEDITEIKKLERMRTDFVSNVSHELKTPLTSIKGFIDTLKNGAIKEEETARRFLDIIDIEAERLYTLIQDILILSEIEQKKDYEMLPCDVNQCMKDVIELLERNLNKGVVFLYKENPIRPFSCNPDRLKQLLINLLDNAVKYTEKGSITMECREEENNLILKISDTGIGIGKEDLPRIFERFYRVDKSRSRKKGGTGLGLSIVKHVVELYNGRIEIESEQGKGTTFLIKLPHS